MEVKSVSKKKRLKLQRAILLKKLYYLNTHNPLFKNFNNITSWLNLTYVNLSCNMITILPSAFGKLRLNRLDLSQNCLGTSRSTKWQWMEHDIKNTLHFLDIGNNSLTQLPLHIGRLSALVSLNIRFNLLKYLPQTIGNMKNLKILHLSSNTLVYLPVTMIFLNNLQYLDISKNPLQIYEHDNEFEVSISSLVQLSANTVLRHRILYDTRLPSALVEYLEEAECCILCERSCMDLLPVYILYRFLAIADFIVCSFLEVEILFECYCCPPFCKDNPEFYNEWGIEKSRKETFINTIYRNLNKLNKRVTNITFILPED